MSEEEQFAIIGRLTKEMADMRKQAAFVRQELEFVVKGLDALISSLRPRTNASTATGGRTIVLEHVTKYMDPSKIISLTDEQDRLAREIEEHRIRLSELGAI